MIFTVNMNPSLDYYMSGKELIFNKTNRSDREVMRVGGKGINISMLLRNMSLESTIVAPLAGFTGKEIKRNLDSLGIESLIINNDGLSRINVKYIDNSNHAETEINATGPHISDLVEKNIIDSLIKTCENGDYICLSGSAGNLAAERKDRFYADLMGEFKNKNLHFIVDATGKSLINCLQYKPFLIKPNLDELADIMKLTGRDDLTDKIYLLKKSEKPDRVEEYKDYEDIVDTENLKTIIEAGRLLLNCGAMNCIISMGGMGSVFINSENCLYSPAVTGKVISTVAAGDSMIAGFLKAITDGRDWQDAYRLACACGAATAMSEGMAEEIRIRELYTRVRLIDCHELA